MVGTVKEIEAMRSNRKGSISNDLIGHQKSPRSEDSAETVLIVMDELAEFSLGPLQWLLENFTPMACCSITTLGVTPWLNIPWWCHNIMLVPLTKIKPLHGDLKPANIMLDSEFNARLGDFGLARALDKDKTSYIEAEGVHGTLGYIASECFHTVSSKTWCDICVLDFEEMLSTAMKDAMEYCTVQWARVMEAKMRQQTTITLTCIKPRGRLCDHVRSIGLKMKVEDVRIEDLASEIERINSKNCIILLSHMGRKKSRSRITEFHLFFSLDDAYSHR